jgi:hypothetical protein
MINSTILQNIKLLIYKDTRKSMLSLLFNNKKNFFNFCNGILVKKPLSELKLEDGMCIITHEGDCGRIVKRYIDYWKPKQERWVNVKLDNKNYRHAHINSFFQLFLYLPITGKNYSLSNSCYKFIVPSDIHKVLSFRITIRGYAMLTDDFKIDREAIAELRRTRQGAALLDIIDQKNYKIIKK